MIIGIIRGLGGNGGTFLARAIAAMQGTVLLSETNPLTANLFGFALNPVVQIERNYSQYRFKKYPRNIVELGSPALFGEYIQGLKTQCEEKSLHLVIRDYNYADFIGVPFVWPTPGRSSLDAGLEDALRKEFVLVRHPLAQFQSLISHGELKHVLNPNLYLSGACRMLEAYAGITIFRYEDIFSTFENEFVRMVAHLDIRFDPNFMLHLPKTQWVTGHAAGKKASGPESAKRLDQDRATELRETFLTDPNYKRLCTLSGYDP